MIPDIPSHVTNIADKLGQNKKVQPLGHFDFNKSFANVKFQATGTTDYYRKGNPYKIMSNPGTSAVNITFDIKRKDILHLVIWLNHCRTSADGIVDIYVNKHAYKHTYQNAPKWNFGREHFLVAPSMLKLPSKDNQSVTNTVRIKLNNSSPGVYWLSDAQLALMIDQPGWYHLSQKPN